MKFQVSPAPASLPHSRKETPVEGRGGGLQAAVLRAKRLESGRVRPGDRTHVCRPQEPMKFQVSPPRFAAPFEKRNFFWRQSMGLVGQVKAKEIEVGTSNSSMVRIVATLVGVLFIVLSFDPDLPRSFLVPAGKRQFGPARQGRCVLEGKGTGTGKGGTYPDFVSPVAR